VFVTTRHQGDIGEASAIEWLTRKGVTVAIPFGHSPDWDLVVESMGRFSSVQVKTSCLRRDGRWAVAICTRGGNRSWSGIVKRFAASRCDYLFVHVGDGRRWFIPAWAVEAATSITLGGQKYSKFEVESGAPLPMWTQEHAAS
jgi:Holliday junction resolvase-like predicted endonuclease